MRHPRRSARVKSGLAQSPTKIAGIRPARLTAAVSRSCRSETALAAFDGLLGEVGRPEVPNMTGPELESRRLGGQPQENKRTRKQQGEPLRPSPALPHKPGMPRRDMTLSPPYSEFHGHRKNLRCARPTTVTNQDRSVMARPSHPCPHAYGRRIAAGCPRRVWWQEQALAT